jgi:hypothetical protein
MAYKAYKIYIDGELFTTLKAALLFAGEALSRRVGRDELLKAAGRGAALSGPAGVIAVSWKAPRVKKAPAREGAPLRETPPEGAPPPPPLRRRPLLRYRPGEGPLRDGSRVWV